MDMKTIGVVTMLVLSVADPRVGATQGNPDKPSVNPVLPGPKLPKLPEPCGPKGACPDSPKGDIGLAAAAGTSLTVEGCLDFTGTGPWLDVAPKDGTGGTKYKLQLPAKVDCRA